MLRFFVSEYLHQVRSYNRTISATMLFTADTDKSFKDTGCANATFDYTPLSDMNVHWTYQKGDRTIDMGYINLEIVRKNLIEIFHETGKEVLTADDFAYFYAMAIQERKNEVCAVSENLQKLFTSVRLPYFGNCLFQRRDVGLCFHHCSVFFCKYTDLN